MHSQQLPVRIKGVEIETISRILCCKEDYRIWTGFLPIAASRGTVLSKSFWICSVDCYTPVTYID